MKNLFVSIAMMSAAAFSASAQSLFEKHDSFLTLPEHYVCYRTDEKIKVDGKADEDVWQKAEPVKHFADIRGEGYEKPGYETTAKMLWDDDYLYVFARLEEENIQAKLKQRDTIIYYDNDFEVFLDPDGDGQANTVGLAALSTVYGDYPNNTFAIDNIFTALDAYPNIWITDDDGNAVYGSVQPEMKDALQLLADWYAEGLIDKEFTTRTNDDIVALISSGQCGAFIGPWWAPFNPAMTSSYADDDAEWINVSAPVGSDGAINAINTKSYAGFVVVRKGYEHPEIAMKIVNVNSEYAMQDNTDAAKEIKENQSIAYFNWPLYCQVQPGNNAELMTEHIEAVVDGTADASTLTTEEQGYYDSIVRFQEAEAAGEKADSADYSQYMSRMVAIHKFQDEPANFLTPSYFETTETMATKWASLEKMELQTVLQIIVGESDMSAFDEFVDNWTSAGGQTITDEINEELSSK